MRALFGVAIASVPFAFVTSGDTFWYVWPVCFATATALVFWQIKLWAEA